MKKEKQPGDGNVYPKGNVLWLWYYDAKLKRQWLSTELPVGQEKRARASLARIRQDVLKEVQTGVPQGPLTCGRYLDGWLDGRESEGVASTKDDRTRLKHAAPIRDVLLDELTPDHFRDLVRELKARIGPAKNQFGSRTVRHVYFLLRQAMNDAVADRLIPANPCVLKKKEVPKKRDKDPAWRTTAIYTRREVEQLISDERVPEERRTLYGLLFIGGNRISEISGLRIHRYDATMEPLGCLHFSVAWNRKRKVEKGLKTDVPRDVPVHPTLAKLLGRWLVGGWERYMGRPPRPDDLLMPSGADGYLKDNTAHANLQQDLKVLGMRPRRTHDTRRTMITLARTDGANPDILKWITHGPTEAILDVYTSFPWEALCTEIAKLRLELREGRIVQLRKVASTICDSSCDSGSGGVEMLNVPRVLQLQSAVPRAGLEPDFEGRESPVGIGNRPEAFGAGGPQYDPTAPPGVTTVTTSQSIFDQLLAARNSWVKLQDPDDLRRRLNSLLASLPGGES